MIILQPGNKILEECVLGILHDEKRQAVSINLCDFDNVAYKVSVLQDDIDTIYVSMNLPCYQEIAQAGSHASLVENFGPMLLDEPQEGADITLKIEINNLQLEEAELVKRVSLLKAIAIGGPFNHFFTSLEKGEQPGKPLSFNLRDDTCIFFFPKKDRVVVVFSLHFNEKVDYEIAKVMLKEAVLAKKSIGRAPPCSYSLDPPRELQQEFGINEPLGNLGFLSFAVLPSHLGPGKEVVVNLLQGFRNFLQYHIKCSKAHFHARMRKRVKELLLVLNRAKIIDESQDKKKKTYSGKSFKGPKSK